MPETATNESHFGLIAKPAERVGLMAIELHNVVFSYDGVHRIIDGLSLAFPRRGMICLSGPSGCGKTTLLRLIAGLEKPQSGSISGIKQLRIGFVFQENRLLPWMSALDNAAIAAHAANGRELAVGWLERLGLGESLHKRPHEPSGGMKCIALARADIPFDALILDEPFSGLDAALWKSVIYEIQRNAPTSWCTRHPPNRTGRVLGPIYGTDGPPLKIKI